MNRGSEVFRADANGLELVWRREATPEEDSALDAAAEATVRALAALGLGTEIVSQRLNRRKIDLIPDPDWADPPKARISELLDAVEERLRDAGLAGLREAVELATQAAREAGLWEPRVTSDAKHIEIGLTDKADSARWLFGELARTGTGAGLVLVAGDEFGPLGGLPGSDSLLLVPEAARATAVSVGSEPTGVPAEVIALGGGSERFRELLADQLERRRRGDVPEVDAEPGWTFEIEGIDPTLERVHESMLTLADGRVGTRGAPLLAHAAAEPGVLMADLYAGEGAETQLVRAPDWTRLPGRLPEAPSLRRQLDLRRGLLRQDGPLAALQLSSLRRPGTVALRAHGDARRLPRAGSRVEHGSEITLALADTRGDHRLERVAAYGRDERSALSALGAAQEAGFETLFAEHRQAWAGRWEDADVVIEGDPELQRAVRFALFHLMASVDRRGRGGRWGTRALRNWHIEGTSSGTATSSSCPSWPRRTRRRHGQCSSTGSDVWTGPVLRRHGRAMPERGSRGSPRATATTSRRASPTSRRARSRASARANWRSTSRPTSPGRQRATWTGQGTSSSPPVPDASC